MPSTKVQVLHNKMFGGMSRAVPSHDIGEDEWLTQFNFRRVPQQGLVQIPRKRSFLAVAQGEIPANPVPGVQPPKVHYKKYEYDDADTVEIKLKVFTTFQYSISCWTTRKNDYRPVITVLDGETLLGTSVWPPSLTEWTDWYNVVTLTLTPGDYTIHVEAPSGHGDLTVVITGGPEAVYVSGDEGIETPCMVYSSADAAIYFVSRRNGVELLRKWNIFLGYFNDAATIPVEGYFTKHLFYSPTQQTVFAPFKNGSLLKLREVSGLVNAEYTFPTTFEVRGGVYIPATDKIYFYSTDLDYGVLFDCNAKTFTPLTPLGGGVGSPGYFTWQNDQLFYIEPNFVRKVNHATQAVTNNYGVSIDLLHFDAEGGKYYGFSKTLVGFRFNSSFGLESSFSSLFPVCFSVGRRNFIGSAYQETIPSFTCLFEVDKPEGDVVELHQLNVNNNPTDNYAPPIAVWVQEIGRVVVMSGSTAGMVFEIMP